MVGNKLLPNGFWNNTKKVWYLAHCTQVLPQTIPHPFTNSETIGVLTSNMGRVECLFGAGLLVPLQVARCRCKVPLQGLAAKCHCKVPQVKVRCPLGSRVVVPFRGTTGLDLLLSGVYAGIFFFGGGNNIFWTCSHASDPPLYLQIHSSVSVASTHIG